MSQHSIDLVNETSSPLDTQKQSCHSVSPILQAAISTKKRQDYLSWDEYFMAVAMLSAKRSKDPNTQVGACIVNVDNRIVGVGYNGMPRDCPDEMMPWGKGNEDPLRNKYMYVCHAELNAVLNKNTGDVHGCRIYVALFPCNECAKVIIQAGIHEVIYLSDKNIHTPSAKASHYLFQVAGVKMRQFIPSRSLISLSYDCENVQQISQE